MKILAIVLIFFAEIFEMKSQSIFIEAESFSAKGGWVVDPQFVEQMGSPYLLAHGMGIPVEDAITSITVEKPGKYHVWVRTKNWAPGKWEAPGRFLILVDGRKLERELGRNPGWNWEYAGSTKLAKGKSQLLLHDLTGFEGRCDAIYLTLTENEILPSAGDALKKWRLAQSGGSDVLQKVAKYDLVVVGGGIAGCAASIAAAEQGLKVALVHDRPVLGGNASGEIRVHTLGIYGKFERILKMLDTGHYPNGSAEALKEDQRRMENVKKYENIDLFLNFRAYAAEAENNRVTLVDARNTSGGEQIRFKAPLFVDCTGDGWIGYWAGAEYNYGREASTTYNENWNAQGLLWSPETSDNFVMGSSVLWGSFNAGKPVKFPEVPWAMDIAKNYAENNGEWQWEFSRNDLSQIDDAETIRDHLFRAIYGSFYNYKNPSARKLNTDQGRMGAIDTKLQQQKADSLQLKWVSHLLGKRESRRLVGDHIFTFNDARDSVKFEDAVVFEKRDVDVHFQVNLLDQDDPDFISEAMYYNTGQYSIPYRSLYSKNISNLFMAGRNFSCSHLGLGGPRVMRTTGQMGAAVGLAASICKKYNVHPRDVYTSHLKEYLELIEIQRVAEKPVQISGIYPHLAYYNNEGECGTGAVVPWAGKLWVITYGPHLPLGSSDKLYEIGPDLRQNIRPESIGGTPANRMVHKESNQLFIGPYAIDNDANVRVIPYKDMPGRHTGNARHLTDPTGKIYYGTMEEGFYEVDVKTMQPVELYKDGNTARGTRVVHSDTDANPENAMLPGAHGKGLYSGQGVLVYSNNGEASQEALSQFDIKAGSLTEWNGTGWKVVRRNQFVEVTGPGGIFGNPNPATDPIWVTGWDHKSVLLGVRDAESGWSFYRLPKASHSYDGAHGWNTEWPRIRDIGTPDKPDYLMTMHGMFWRFPGTFTSKNSASIRPRSAYLKVIGDFTRWNDQLVFGCDDSANKEFLNRRKVKGSLEGPGQSNSNVWFTTTEKPDLLGPVTAEGAVWLSEEIEAGTASEPFLFAGWDIRSAWILNEGKQTVSFTFEVDEKGNNEWKNLKTVHVQPGESTNVTFDRAEKGEWVNVTADKPTKATVHFSYAQKERRTGTPDPVFAGLATVSESETSAGLLWGLGNNRRKLGVLAGTTSGDTFAETGYYEMDSLMNLVETDDPETAGFIREKFAIPQQVITIDESSVLVVDDLNRRWRLPKGDPKYADLTNHALLRICREVATERDLFNCAGSFYELPAENADGFAKIRPISSHNFRIHDYASYRGMLIMTGLDVKKAKGNSHIIVSDDQKAAVWAGVIDDLWQLGKPVGEGGPWKNSAVKAGEISDPYLIGFYDQRILSLSHDSKELVTFTMEVEPVGHGPWMKYRTITVRPAEVSEFLFPDSFQSRWIRFSADRECKATAWLKYK